MSKFFDKIADALVPKEIAPFLGPASMAFAGPLGLPLALALGQLGSAKMHSGKLDPYTALGTVMSARASGFDRPTVSKRLGKGIGTLFDSTEGNADLFAGFRKGAFPTSTPANVSLMAEGQLQDPVGTGKTTAEATKDFENKLAASSITDPNIDMIPKKSPGDPNLIRQGIGIFDDISETIFPGFMDGDKFSLGKSLTTIGAITSLSQMTNAAEALKKQKIKDEKEQGRIWREWFTKYENLSGVPYPEDNPSVADPYLIEKYNKYMLANGGRVGYNEGGGIMDVAPGIPKGMELDYRDSGGFIPMGSKEKKDDVPAVLAKNEFVLTSDAMKGLDKMMGGTGDPRAAAKYMYNMMDQLEAMA